VPPERRRWTSLIAWAAAGAVWFLWLGSEDVGPRTPVAVSAVLAAAWGLSVALRREGEEAARRLLLVGLAAGAAVGPLAALLMLIKVSIHAHPVPEFTPTDLRAAIGRTPLWAGIGLLVGAAAALVQVAWRSRGGGEVQSMLPRRDDDG
jgi:hypothetical protein